MRGLLIIGLALGIGCAQAQPAKTPRVGFLYQSCKPDDRYRAFEQGLRDLGYIPGRTITIDFLCHPKAQDMRGIATEAVKSKADVIVVGTPAMAMAARAVTGEVPIVCGSCGDPVENGLVANLARPGGNVTGLASLSAELMGKRLEVARELAPGTKRVAVLINPDNPGTRANIETIGNAARTLGVEIHRVEFRGVADLERAFGEVAATGAGVLLVQDDPYALVGRAQIAALAIKHRLPAIAGSIEIAEAGVLVVYGPNRLDLFRRAAGFVDRLLKGAKPATLPFEQPSKFELVVNLKTAAALGITMPPALVLRADRTIR
ncbi:MAG TPA: ABC transporter substrate-binding protein [Burkholderiales bacterium]|nr:ABC transporter substrate-binding protein [Burkholderiales bacterium]